MEGPENSILGRLYRFIRTHRRLEVLAFIAYYRIYSTSYNDNDDNQ